MILNEEKGGYARGVVVRLAGAFRINGTTTPDTKRDGGSLCVSTVVRNSAGNFTVTFDAGFPLPERLFGQKAEVSQAAAPTQHCRAYVVVDSYSMVTRSFIIQCDDFETPSAVDPDDNDMIFWELVGSISSPGTDPA